MGSRLENIREQNSGGIVTSLNQKALREVIDNERRFFGGRNRKAEKAERKKSENVHLQAQAESAVSPSIVLFKDRSQPVKKPIQSLQSSPTVPHSLGRFANRFSMPHRIADIATIHGDNALTSEIVHEVQAETPQISAVRIKLSEPVDRNPDKRPWDGDISRFVTLAPIKS